MARLGAIYAGDGSNIREQKLIVGLRFAPIWL